jgi:hypothetical protein
MVAVNKVPDFLDPMPHECKNICKVNSIKNVELLVITHHSISFLEEFIH